MKTRVCKFVSFHNSNNTNMKYQNTINYKNQKGLSLIELMISMVVGLFLLAGVVTNFLSTKDSDRYREAISEMDANAAYAMKVLRQTITHTGYASTNNVMIDKPFLSKNDPDVVPSTCATANRLNQINKRKTKDAGVRDFLTVIYLSDNPCKNGAASCSASTSLNINEDALVYTDCTGGGARRVARDVSCSTDPNLGIDPREEAKIYNTFRVNGATTGTLMCHGSRGGGQPVVDNVFALQFLYGVKDEGTNSMAYRTATEVDLSDRWGQVRSVQVGLLMRSSDANLLKKANPTFKYKVLDREVVIPKARRKHIYRLYTSTINLENLNKEPLGQGT